MKKPLLLFLILNLLFSCRKELIEESILSKLTPFNQIEVNDAFEVFLSEDNSYSITIVGDEKSINYVSFNITDNVLQIENNKKAKWISPTKNKIKLYIKSHPLQKVIASEGCNIQTIGAITAEEFGLILTGKSNQANLKLNCKSFYYWNNFPCGGKLTLSGNTDLLKIWNFALMSVDAKNLNSKDAIIENSSKGDCEVTVTNKLEYSIKGNGNIYLYGTPLEITENNLSSSGRLIHK